MAVMFLLVVGGLLAQPSGVVGTLPEDYCPGLKVILQTALKQSPQMLMQNLTVAQSEATRYAYDSAFWPSLTGSGGYGKSGSRSASTGADATFSSSTGANYNITVSQALFQWGVNKARSDIGKLAVQVADHQYADSYRGLVSTLRMQYLSLVTRKALLRNGRYQLKIEQDGLGMQEELLKSGNISEGDIVGTRLSFQESSLNLERQVEDYENAKRLMLRTAGMDQLDEESIPSEIPRPVPVLALTQALVDNFLHDGAEQTPQGQVYVLTQKQNDLNYHIAKVGLLYPKFSLAGTYALSSYGTPQPNGTVIQSQVVSYNIGVNAYVPIFDGFANHGAKLSALLAKRTTDEQFRNYVNTVTDSVLTSSRNMGFLSRALEFTEARRALAEDAVHKLAEQVKEGSQSQSMLENTTVSFYYADYTAIVARAEYLNRWSDFVSLVGADPIVSALPARYSRITHGK